MKKIITILALIASINAFADSETDCWTDSSGQTHCTTTSTQSGDITPRGW